MVKTVSSGHQNEEEVSDDMIHRRQDPVSIITMARKEKRRSRNLRGILDDTSKNAKIVSTKTLEKTAIISCSC